MFSPVLYLPNVLIAVLVYPQSSKRRNTITKIHRKSYFIFRFLGCKSLINFIFGYKFPINNYLDISPLQIKSKHEKNWQNPEKPVFADIQIN